MATVTVPPARRPDLILRPLGNAGRVVVKDPVSGNYFNLEAPEAFLLEGLNGRQGVDDICLAFEARFGDALTPEDLEQFIEIARAQRFLVSDALAEVPNRPTTPALAPKPPPGKAPGVFDWLKGATANLLFWRKSLVDPDRFLTWLAPRVSFLWTRAFLVLSLTGIAWALLLLLVNWPEYKDYFVENLRWDTVLLAYVAIVLATALHEVAHGLTCKRFGGEVHEIGVLFLFFLPCLYCNVSDAWLIRERSRRMLVTLAGAYCDLCVFALAVFAWRVTLPETMPHLLAWGVLSVCGVRFFFNFLPLFKLDGYYLLSDWAEIPNLRQRALDHVAAHARWLLWGAERPEREERGRFLLVFGLACFAFSVFYLGLMLWALTNLALYSIGVIGLAPVGLLAWLVVPGLFQAFSKGEMRAMFLKRHKRLTIWLAVLAGLTAILVLVPVPDRASGTFKIRAASRAEVRAPAPGFLNLIHLDEGSTVQSGTVIAMLEIPDLESRLAQKAAEMNEADAKLRLLELGPRQEEVLEQRHRVRRAATWRDLAGKDLERKMQALEQELSRLDKQIQQAKTQYDFATDALDRAKRLLDKKAIALDRFRDLEKDHALFLSQWHQALAQKEERLAVGVLEQENELARREKDLADARAALTLLEVGTRPEEIQAEKARLTRLTEEKRYLEGLKVRVRLTSPISGIIITAHLREKIGHYFKEGDLICEVEDLSGLEAEITLEEQEVAKVAAGQPVAFKARSLAFKAFDGNVERIAPQAATGKVQSTVTVSCRLEDPPSELRSGMTGYARIQCGTCSLGSSLFGRIFRFVRTEYWW